MTNELLKKNAATLKMATIDTAKESLNIPFYQKKCFPYETNIYRKQSMSILHQSPNTLYMADKL